MYTVYINFVQFKLKLDLLILNTVVLDKISPSTNFPISSVGKETGGKPANGTIDQERNTSTVVFFPSPADLSHRSKLLPSPPAKKTSLQDSIALVRNPPRSPTITHGYLINSNAAASAICNSCTAGKREFLAKYRVENSSRP